MISVLSEKVVDEQLRMVVGDETILFAWIYETWLRDVELSLE